MAILEVKHIEKHFDNTKVLEDVSFELEEGSALAIIGSSGSGKTTLLRCLNFLESPSGCLQRNARISSRIKKLFWRKSTSTGARCWHRWDSPSAKDITRISSPAVSSSVWRSHAHLP